MLILILDQHKIFPKKAILSPKWTFLFKKMNFFSLKRHLSKNIDIQESFGKKTYYALSLKMLYPVFV